MKSEAAARADFSDIRYAQVWEDADVLLDDEIRRRVQALVDELLV